MFSEWSLMGIQLAQKCCQGCKYVFVPSAMGAHHTPPHGNKLLKTAPEQLKNCSVSLTLAVDWVPKGQCNVETQVDITPNISERLQEIIGAIQRDSRLPEV